MKSKHIMAALALIGLSLSVHADLARVGPTNIPSPPGHGYPKWYQDLNGTVLDLCLPDTNDPGALQQTACLLVGPGLPATPYSFPANFPDESFYFRATALVNIPGGKRASLVLALESAFATGGVVAGEQITFSRIRVFAGMPEAGIYTVTHPYGIESFPVDTVAAGNRDIVFSEDVGVSPRVFDGALHSRVGPFLERANLAGAPLGPVTLNGGQFLSDGIAPEFVTGSPFGTNYFEVCGERADGTPIILGTQGVSGTCVRTGQFSLTGRLHDFVANPIPSPLDIYNGFYRRDAAGTQVDVYARDIKVLPTQPLPLLTAATTNMDPVKMVPFGPPALGQYYTQGLVDPSGELPGPVSVINSADTPPSLFTKHVTDVVTIVSANYDYATQALSVIATSSDKGFGVGRPAPTLSLDGFNETVLSTNNLNDPAEVKLTVAGVTTPPDTVTIKSTAGGSKTFFLSRNQATGVNAPAAGVPFAQNDSASALVAGPVLSIPVTANDVANPAAPITAVQLIGAAPPASFGSASVLGTSINFTPGAVEGNAVFQYAATSIVGQSNVATVTVAVVLPVPTANADGPVTVNVKQPLAISVLANDAANGGILNPASVVISNVTGGTAVKDASGVVTYTAGPLVGNFGFDYTVANTNGKVSLPAHVTVTVTGPVPLATADGPLTLPVKRPAVIDVLANDSGNGGTLNLTSVTVSNVTGGTAVAGATGKVTYTAGVTVGTFGFDYTVANDNGNVSALAHVTVVLIEPVPIANADGPVSVAVSQSGIINVLLNDSANGGTLNPASVVVSGVTGGTAVADATGKVTYTAGALVGAFGFNYTVANDNGKVSAPAHVTVNVTGPAPLTAADGPVTVAVNQSAVISVLANDLGNGGTLNPASVVVSNVTGGTAVANATGKVTYTAGATAGTFGFDYKVANTNGSVSALTHVTVTLILPTPIATADGPVSVNINQSAVVSVLSNDSGNGGTLNPASVVVSGITGGTATADPTGKVTYKAGAVSGTFGFNYTVANANGKVSAPAHVTMTITQPIPIAVADGPVIAVTGRSTTINVLLNDSGNGGALNTLSVVLSNVTGGTANNARGVVTYRARNTAGTFGFDYTVANTNGRVSPRAHVTVKVIPPEVLQITAATCTRVNVTTGNWLVTGTSTVSTNNSIQLYRTASVPANLNVNKLGAAVPVTLGTWRFNATGPACTARISALSSATKTKRTNRTVTIR